MCDVRPAELLAGICRLLDWGALAGVCVTGIEGDIAGDFILLCRDRGLCVIRENLIGISHGIVCVCIVRCSCKFVRYFTS